MAPHVVAQRNHYLRTLLKNRNLESNSKLEEIYLNESYIHQYYCRHDDSIYDPNDEQYFQLRKPNKGKRICFIAAIRYNYNEFKSGLVPNSLWHFIPTANNQKGDYHTAFNRSNFLRW